MSKIAVIAGMGIVLLLGPPASAAPRPDNAFSLRVHTKRWGDYRVKRLPDGSMRFIRPGFIADVAPHGAVRFKFRTPQWMWRQTALHFDVTTAVMRTLKQAPYGAEKLRFLAGTSRWRRALRKAYRRRAEQRYFVELPRRLKALWSRNRITVRRRRVLLFQLWEECLEPDGSPITRMAARARGMIEAFIREKLPKGAPHAYTPVELGRYNRRRRGREQFRPYIRRKTPRPSSPRSK